MKDLWYLSFVDLPRNEPSIYAPMGFMTRPALWLGAALVEATDVVDAARQARRLGCNPGGEVVGVRISDRLSFLVTAHWRNRLLDRGEVETLDRLLAD